MVRLLLFFVLITADTTAQNSFFHLMVGGTHYSGDLGNAPIPKLIYLAGGVGFGIELNRPLTQIILKVNDSR